MSPVFTQPDDLPRQLTLEIEPGLAGRFRDLRECIAQGVYQRGLTYVAGQLDKSPGNLSGELSDRSERKFGVEDLERYVERTGDLTPVHYLIARFMGDQHATRDHALNQVAEMLQRLPQMLSAAGLQQTPVSPRMNARRTR